MDDETDELRERILRDIEDAGKQTEHATPNSDDEGEDDMGAEFLMEGVSDERTERFYDRFRRKVRSYVEREGDSLGKVADYLLLAPDVFILLWRLVNDPRVGSRSKVLLGTGVAYYVFPFDLMPEAILGPTGYVEDLVLGVLILSKILKDTDVEVLEDNWSGNGELLVTMRSVIESAENLVPQDIMARIRRVVK